MLEFSDFNRENADNTDKIKISLSKDYRVFVNGEEVSVYTCRISKYPFNTWWPGHQRYVDQTEIVSYVNIVSDEAFEVEIEPLTKTAYERIMVKPYAKNVSAEKKGNRIAFTLKENGGYIFELDDYHGLLYIFNNKPCPCPSLDKVTYYFGAGVHFAGKIELKSNESIYLEKDALVYGCVFSENTENIHIYGNGIFDDGTEERVCENCIGKYSTNGNLKFIDCRGIKLEGLGFTNSAIWCVNIFRCYDVEIDSINVFGQWRYNTDGIDVVNSKDVTIKNSFVHSFDDTIVIKGIDRYREQSNTDMLIENCVLICDWGRALEIGLETECREYKNITFRGCHVIRGGNIVCDIHNGDCALVHNVLFEDISVELESFYTREQHQENDEQTYTFQNTTQNFEIVRISNPRFREMYAFLENIGVGDNSDFGKAHYASSRNITVRNITVYADDNIIANEGTKCVKIVVRNRIATTEFKDLLVENVSLNGKRLSPEEMSVTIEGCPENVLTVK